MVGPSQLDACCLRVPRGGQEHRAKHALQELKVPKQWNRCFPIFEPLVPSSSCVTRAANTTLRGKGQREGRSRRAASLERRVLKGIPGIPKLWQQQLQKEHRAEQEVPSVSAPHPTELGQQVTTRHGAKQLLQQLVCTDTMQSSSHLTPS